MSHQHPLPDGWAIKPLGDPSLAKINPQYDLTGGPYPFVPMDAVANGFAGIEYFDSVQDASGGYSRFREGDILFAKITPCAENGKLALVKGIDDKLGLGSTEFHVISPAKGVNGQFLYYLFSSGHVHRLAISLMEGTTGRQRIPASIFKKRLSAPVPLDDREQEQIASILYKVDEDIQTTKKTIAKAERLKKALMQNLLTGRLRPDGIWRKEEDFYIDEKFGKVPKGWKVARVKYFGDVRTGKTPPTDEENNFGSNISSNYMFITPGDLGESRLILKTERYVTEKGLTYTYKVPAYSVCVVCIGSTIGKVGINESEACTNQQINTVTLNDRNDAFFFYYMMQYRSAHFKEYAGINVTPQVNKSGFKKYRLLQPESKSEQEQISSRLLKVDLLIEEKQIKIQKLERLKKALMHNLLTGKVRVKIEK